MTYNILARVTAHSLIPRDPHRRIGDFRALKVAPQKFFLSAATGKAFTTVFAGLAFTTTILPKISLLPALVAGFLRVLILARPGMTNKPLFFTCSAAMLARLSRT